VTKNGGIGNLFFAGDSFNVEVTVGGLGTIFEAAAEAKQSNRQGDYRSI